VGWLCGLRSLGRYLGSEIKRRQSLGERYCDIAHNV